MFIPALLIIFKSGKKLKYPPTDQRINKNHKMECYLVIERNEVLICATTQVKSQSIMLSERCQTQKCTYSMIPFMCNVQKCQSYIERK